MASTLNAGGDFISVTLMQIGLGTDQKSFVANLANEKPWAMTMFGTTPVRL